MLRPGFLDDAAGQGWHAVQRGCKASAPANVPFANVVSFVGQWLSPWLLHWLTDHASPHQHILWQRQQAIPLPLLVGLRVWRLCLALLQVALALRED